MKYLTLLLASLAYSSAWIRHSHTTTRPHKTRIYLASLDDLQGKTLFQRSFYQWTPNSDVAQHDVLVLEERTRFQKDPNRPGYVTPVGPGVSLLFRDGTVEDGEIGDEFFTLHTTSAYVTEETIATGLYLASNPSLCQKQMLQVAAGGDSSAFLAGLIGCIGAAHAAQRGLTETLSDDDVDILSLPSKQKSHFPKTLEKLVFSDANEQAVEHILHQLHQAKMVTNEVYVEILDWKNRPISRSPPKEYHTVFASDVAFTYPEAKELARTVAYRTMAGTAPSFVHVCPDTRDDAIYLRQCLEKGYKMMTSPGFLKLEKIIFDFQTLPVDQDERMLDDLELNVKDIVTHNYQSLVAKHHPDYRGEGTGEMFFPVEVGPTELETDGGYEKFS